MPQPLLRYQLQLSQGQTTSLTYVNAGQTATLTVIVSNAGANVTIRSLTFDLSPFGQNATDLATSVTDITPMPPTGWQSVAGTSFTLVPSVGSAIIGTTPLTFEFQVRVNQAAGTSLLAITEVSASGTAHVAPIAITKMPASFTLSKLSAAPALVEPNATVTLSWSCDAGQLYTVGFPGGTATVTPPSGGTVTWVSPPVKSTFPSITFTVSASTQVDGQVLSAELSTTVTVDVPQIISFDQPAAAYSSPVILHWETLNADRCVLYADGVVVDQHAPANPGSGGYPVTPKAHSTQYQLHAYRNQAFITSQPIFVTLYNWAFLRSFKWGDESWSTSLALSADGEMLYFGGTNSVDAIDTNGFTLVGQGTVAGGVAPGGLALSNDGTTLYVSEFRGNLLAFQTADLAATPITIPVSGGAIALSPDGSTLYSIENEFTGKGVVHAVSTATNTVAHSAEVGVIAVDMSLSRDGATLYVLADENVHGQCTLYGIDTATFAATRLLAVGGNTMTLSKDGKTLFCCKSTSSRMMTTTVEALDVPGFTVRSTVTPLAEPVDESGQKWAAITSMTADPSGGLFVSIFSYGIRAPFQDGPMELYFVNPATNTVKHLSDSGARVMTGGLVADAAGTRAYFADGRDIMVYTSTGGGSLRAKRQSS